MKIMSRIELVAGLVATGLMAAPAPAAAYVGPGATLAAIGAAIAVVGAVFATVAGFIWYPLKRLRKALTGRSAGPAEAPGEER